MYVDLNKVRPFRVTPCPMRQAQRYSSAIYDACRGVIPKSCSVASSHPFSRPSVRDEARKSARAVSQVPLQHDRARTHGSSVGLRARPPRHRAATPPTLRASGRAGRNRTLAPRTEHMHGGVKLRVSRNRSSVLSRATHSHATTVH